MLCLEEQQDEFDFKYQTFKLEGKQFEKEVLEFASDDYVV